MSTNFLINEEDVWDMIDPEDIWVLDKLILSRYLGYKCGPVGTSVPSPDNYIVRPTINALGMGISSQIVHINKSTDHLLPGHFWCEVFQGNHYSLDFFRGKLMLAVEGIRSSQQDLIRWDRWVQVDKNFFDLPKFLVPLSKKYNWLNLEIIGDKIIEVHLRANPDFWQDPKTPAKEVIPVWDKQPIENLEYKGYLYIPDKDYGTMGLRKGILVKY